MCRLYAERAGHPTSLSHPRVPVHLLDFGGRYAEGCCAHIVGQALLACWSSLVYGWLLPTTTCEPWCAQLAGQALCSGEWKVSPPD